MSASQSTLRHILLHPLGVALSWIITGISISMAFYFYAGTRNFPQLSYTIKPVRGIVVRAERSSNMTVRYNDKIVTTDITAAQVVLWNEGQRPIKKAEVRKPIVIFTENNAPILEASIKKSSREITKLALDEDDIPNGRVNVTWDILEQNDGGTIQIVYEGKPDLNIFVDGVVEGQKQITRIEAPEGAIYRKEFDRTSRKAFEAYETFLLIMLTLSAPLIYIASSSSFPKWSRLLYLLVVLFSMGAIFYDLMYGYMEPPFGF
jgi:hypothetical protein